MKEGIRLFYGEDAFLKQEATKEAVSKFIGPESKGVSRDIDRYNARDDLSGLFDSLNTLPFFSEKKVIIIRDIEHLPEPKKKRLLTYLKNPPERIMLIMQSGRAALTDKFLKALSGLAQSSQFKRPKVWELRDWVYKRLRPYNKTIANDALELLLELKGGKDLGALAGELEKLVTYKGDDKTITKDDVAALVGKGITKRVFALADAIGSGDRDSALLLAREISSESRRGVPEAIGLIGWQLKRLWKAKQLLTQKMGPDSVCAELNIRSFSVKKFLSQVSRFSIEKIKRNLGLLLEADRKVKSGYGKPDFVLEELIMKLCV